MNMVRLGQTIIMIVSSFADREELSFFNKTFLPDQQTDPIEILLYIHEVAGMPPGVRFHEQQSREGPCAVWAFLPEPAESGIYWGAQFRREFKQVVVDHCFLSDEKASQISEKGYTHPAVAMVIEQSLRSILHVMLLCGAVYPDLQKDLGGEKLSETARMIAGAIDRKDNSELRSIIQAFDPEKLLAA